MSADFSGARWGKADPSRNVDPPAFLPEVRPPPPDPPEEVAPRASSPRAGPRLGAAELRVLDRRILRLALPALGALLVEPLYNLTDSAIVGHLGVPQLGALAIATGALNLVWWTAGFIAVSTLTRVARGLGAQDFRGASREVGASYLAAIILGLIGSGVLAALAAPMTTALGGTHAVASYSVTYLRIASIGIVPLELSLAGTGHLNGLGRTRRPFEIALAGCVLNLGLELELVYGVHLGIAGSAWGTDIAQVATALAFWASSARAEIAPARPRMADLIAVVRDGIPLSVRTVALDAALLLSTAVVARLGKADLAGQQIALQVWTLLALTVDALAVPSQVLVAEAAGRGDRSRARAVGRRTLQLGVVAGSILGAATIALAGVLPHLFTTESAVWRSATPALVICGIQQPVAALAFVLDGLLLGLSEYRALSAAMIVALAGFLPLSAAVLVDHSLGIEGVWLGLTAWMLIRTTLLLRRWRARAYP